MDIILSILLWLHFMGLAMALGGGIALSQSGPMLVSVPPSEVGTIWKLEGIFSRIGSIGVGTLIVTGPLMVWLKFGGVAAMPAWFWVKMALVLVAIAGIATHEVAARRFKAGDASAFRWMLISGRAAGASMALVVLCAVLAFQ